MTFVWRIISHVSRYKIVGRGNQCDVKKWFVIRIGQIQNCIGWDKRQSIHLKFDQHLPDTDWVKLETGPGKNFRVLGKDALVMTDLDGSC